MNLDEETHNRWERLIETGALMRVGGTDEEPEYQFNIPVLEVVDPELYQVYIDEIDTMLIDLVVKGYLDIEISETEARYSLTEKGWELADSLKAAGF